MRARALRLVAVSSLAAIVVAGTALTAQLRAAAGSSPTAIAASYYMHSTSTSLAYSYGCNQGTADLQGSIPSTLVWLDFGNQLPNGSGTEEVGDQFTYTNAQIQSLAGAYADGFYYCTGSDTTSHLYLGIGTRNSHDVVGNGTTYANGGIWASVVGSVQAHMNSTFCYNGRCESAQATAWGANDMELSWNSPSYTMAWTNGFQANPNQEIYIDYGSPDGCPSSTDNNGPCNNGWNQKDVWYVSWGATAAFATPQVYYSVTASQWTEISLYGEQYQSNTAYFEGPLDQHPLAPSTNTANAAWSELWGDLNSKGLSSVANQLVYSLEVYNE